MLTQANFVQYCIDQSDQAYCSNLNHPSISSTMGRARKLGFRGSSPQVVEICMQGTGCNQQMSPISRSYFTCKLLACRTNRKDILQKVLRSMSEYGNLPRPLLSYATLEVECHRCISLPTGWQSCISALPFRTSFQDLQC